MGAWTSRTGWLVLAAAAGGILYGMVGYWLRGYESVDRAIIILASAGFVWDRRATLAVPDRPWPILGLFLIVIGTIAYLPPWVVYSLIGPRPVILWWESLALLAAASGYILVRSGPNLLRSVGFSLIFPLFALPLPGRIQSPLQEILQDVAASIAEVLIPICGVPVLQRQGSTLILPSGGINIVEACSGLTQVRAILAVAAVMAHWRGFGLGRGAITVVLAVPVIVLVNALRVTASGLITEWAGREYVEGGWHEALGLALFVFGLGLVYALRRRLERPTDSRDWHFDGLPPVPSRGATGLAVFLLASGLAAGLILPFALAAERSVPEPPDFHHVPTTIDKWRRYGDDNAPMDYTQATKLDFETVQSKLTFNSGLHRIYEREDMAFQKADVWFLYWKSSMVVKDYHHPDVCFRVRGDTTLAAGLETVHTPGGRAIAMTYREFKHEDNVLQLLYWTQEGRRIWTEEDERRAASFLFPFTWVRERLHADREDCDDRLTIMVGMPLFRNSPAAKQKVKLIDFAGRIADETYTVCPWADPKTP